MRKRKIFLRAILLLAPSRVLAYNSNDMRCQLYGINYNDCLSSIYRPMPAYDSYAKSFNLPIHKDEACAYSMCKIAMLANGLEKFISIANKAHPPGECICLGSNSCGCETMAIPSEIPHMHIPSVVTKTVSKTKTVRVNVTESPPDDETIEVHRVPISALDNVLFGGKTQNTLLEELDKKIQILQNQNFPKKLPNLKPNHNIMENAMVPPENAALREIPKFHMDGNVITIPFSTTTTTVQVSVPVYKTTVRTQYVVNTVDNYITETKTKTEIKTVVKTETETTTKTQTETISDHVERTKFSTIFVPKTVTVDKVSIKTKHATKTTTVTTVKTVQPTEEKTKIKTKTEEKIITPSSEPKADKKYYIVKKLVKKRLVCKEGCTNPNIPLSGECPMGAMGTCPPNQMHPGFIRPAAPTNIPRSGCIGAECPEVVKTVYVKSSAPMSVK
ncbi:hypothetical protein NEMIN01_2421 [Nematocida minor]|uniref:uncharacterized protein n=1 Tax=Nematocida minor TaxID=1912983 RepID=UPI00221E612A|nr:uncharacterized protein NEMIN01_2421 [Nematocida minor]KAI5193223.1 hypothetical protein NEMIN01_2421 [Nematocida minor]